MTTPAEKVQPNGRWMLPYLGTQCRVPLLVYSQYRLGEQVSNCSIGMAACVPSKPATCGQVGQCTTQDWSCIGGCLTLLVRIIAILVQIETDVHSRYYTG